jgi:RNA polymerase-binding protein
MSERSLRGARLGAQSLEDDHGVELAPRQQVAYSCPEDHRFSIPLAEEADVPASWECPRCGSRAQRVDAAEPVLKTEKPVRTHWDMLLERRSMPELEELLEERLQLLRGGQIGPAHLHRRSTRAADRQSA